MKKVIVLFLLALAMIPVQLTAQMNPQKGYIITCIKGTGKLIRYQGREISQEILCHD